MQAAYYNREGASSTLVVAPFAIPKPKDEEMLIRILASSVNPVDVKMRATPMTERVRPLPKITGCDFSGVVVDISACSDPKMDVGDLVFGIIPDLFANQGTCCEFICMREEYIAHAPKRAKPPLFTEAEIASLPLVGLTVLQAFEPFVQACEREYASKREKHRNAQAADGGDSSGGEIEQETQQDYEPHGAPEAEEERAEEVEDSDAGSDVGTDIGYNENRQKARQLFPDRSGTGFSDAQNASESTFRKTSAIPSASAQSASISTSASVTAGKAVLIEGGAGGLGSFAIQYCKNVLHMRVIVTCSARSNHFCKKLGADVCIDYNENPRFLETCELIRCVDVVFDPFSWLYRDATLNSKLPVLKRNGWYLDIASSPHSRKHAISKGMTDPLELTIPEASYSSKVSNFFYSCYRNVLNVATLAVEKCMLLEVPLTSVCTERSLRNLQIDSNTITYRRVVMYASAKHLRQISRLARSGLCLPVVNRKNIFAFSTDGVRTAHDLVENSHTKGKVVIAISSTAGIRGGGISFGSAAIWEETKH